MVALDRSNPMFRPVLTRIILAFFMQLENEKDDNQGHHVLGYV